MYDQTIENKITREIIHKEGITENNFVPEFTEKI